LKSFVRVAEIWVPDSHGYLLEFGGGLYEQAPEFGAISRSMCFGLGEGLPGRVWQEGRPLILKDLQGGYFQRAAAAKAAELSCAVAFPIFFDDRLKSVVVLFCGSVEGLSGAIEVWHNDPRVTTDLTLVEGVYGANDAAFEAASRDATMPRGVGLPGLAWQRQASVFMDGLSESTKFLRSDDAAETGIRSGLAFPCPVPGNDNFVLAFLSAPAMPIATCMQSWVEGDDGQSLDKSWSSASATAGMAEVARSAVFKAFASGVAQVGGLNAAPPSSMNSPFDTAGEALLALPIARDGAVSETVALYF
jgi:hypothetical protein